MHRNVKCREKGVEPGIRYKVHLVPVISEISIVYDVLSCLQPFSHHEEIVVSCHSQVFLEYLIKSLNGPSSQHTLSSLKRKRLSDPSLPAENNWFVLCFQNPIRYLHTINSWCIFEKWRKNVGQPSTHRAWRPDSLSGPSQRRAGHWYIATSKISRFSCMVPMTILCLPDTLE